MTEPNYDADIAKTLENIKVYLKGIDTSLASSF